MAESNLGISLHDAANNCSRDGAVATLTLRSGIQFTGKLEKPGVNSPTVHMETDGQGWTTIERDELAAVGVRRG